MSPSKAILTGSAIIAIAVIATSYIGKKDIPVAPVQTAAVAPVAATPVPDPNANRYQIIKVEGSTSWRLDKQTGEIAVCRLEGDRMVCAKSTTATEMPKASPDELAAERKIAEAERLKEEQAAQAERDKARQEKRAERSETLKMFMNFFERIIRFAQDQTERENNSNSNQKDDITKL